MEWYVELMEWEEDERKEKYQKEKITGERDERGKDSVLLKYG